MSLVPKTAYIIDSIGFMFTKCQNHKSFIYNKLSDFRESLLLNQTPMARILTLLTFRPDCHPPQVTHSHLTQITLAAWGATRWSRS